MANIQTDGLITRTELGLGNLAFTPANGYYIARSGFGPGEVTNRTSYVQSPYVIGQTLVHAVKDMQTSTLQVRVKGSSQSDMYTKMTTLCTAFEQFSYNLTIIINGVSFTYACDVANYTVGDGGNLDDLWLRSDTQMLAFEIPHKPKQVGFK